MEITIQFKITELDGYSSKSVALSEVRRCVIDTSRIEQEASAAIDDAQMELDRQLTVIRKAKRAADLEASRLESAA